MSSTVLVPIDGSPLSVRALRHAFRKFPDGEVVAYHVVDLFDPGHGDESFVDAPSVYEPMMGTDEWYGAVEESTDRLFAEVEEVAEEYDRSVTTESDIGDPARLVVEYATEEDVDHVVIGAHGRPDERRTIYGSVSETVVRRVPVPITVVR
ncbi:universal stress protein [Natronobacterium texcoconense]|uniref:Nucleotide-binding universal stress protein, UspA family n=1 Tax=Natronobacterium texcoconense TaxID=1095778 RepID=A0A1H1BY43_NATTX|nr:universal stress protein [Natronobacterium texcoconense]SDQ56853.1 Nucleotide-binding universal stress protein, UspA family [Natronobacterium texcoconense]